MAISPLVPDSIGNNKFPAFSNTEIAITATPSGTQANSYQMGAQSNRVDTVATAGDGVKLPKISPLQGGILSKTGVTLGTPVVVTNNSANALRVYPGLLDTINGVASATGVQIPAGLTVLFIPQQYTQSTKVGTWMALGLGGVGITLASQLSTINTASPVTLTGAQEAGAENVVINMTTALGAGGTLNSATAAQIIAAIPNATVGTAYNLRIINSSSGNFAWTLTTATGVTLTGTMTIAQNTFRDFIVQVTGAATVTITSIGTGTTS